MTTLILLINPGLAMELLHKMTDEQLQRVLTATGPYRHSDEYMILASREAEIREMLS